MTKSELRDFMRKNESYDILLIIGETSKEITVEKIIDKELFIETELNDLRKIKNYLFENNKAIFDFEEDKYMIVLL
jgi:hypothetical protein